MPPSPIVSESHAGIGRRASRRPRILNVEQISDTKSVESFNGVAKSLKSDRAAENLKSMGSPDTVMATAPSPMVLTLPPAFTSRSAARKYWTIAIAVIAIIIAWQMIDSLVELSAAAVTLDGQFISGFTHLITINLDSAFLGAAFAGFVAQVVDGALGMGFGVTSTTIMVSVAGLSPLAASTCVHLAQLGTTCLSGLSHYSCGNVDMTTMRRMSPSGMAGAFAGATFLASMPSSTAILVSAGLLFGLGAYVLWRFALCEITPAATASDKSPGWSLLLPLGAWGGFVDATGGGGWGPVATTGLLADGRLTPTKVVGTVSAAEFLVTVAAVAGFVRSLGTHLDALGSRVDLVVALLAGGILAAPLAPLFVRRLEPDTLGVSIGGFICLTNSRVLLKHAHADRTACVVAYALIFLAWMAALAVIHRRRSNASAQVRLRPGLWALRASLSPPAVGKWPPSSPPPIRLVADWRGHTTMSGAMPGAMPSPSVVDGMSPTGKTLHPRKLQEEARCVANNPYSYVQKWGNLSQDCWTSSMSPVDE